MPRVYGRRPGLRDPVTLPGTRRLTYDRDRIPTHHLTETLEED